MSGVVLQEFFSVPQGIGLVWGQATAKRGNPVLSVCPSHVIPSGPWRQQCQLQNGCLCTSQLRGSIVCLGFCLFVAIPAPPTPSNTTTWAKLPGPIGCAISSNPCPCLARGVSSHRGRGEYLFLPSDWLSMDSTVIKESVAKTLKTASLLMLESLQRNYCDVAGVPLGHWAAGEWILTILTTENMACLVKGFLWDGEQPYSWQSWHPFSSAQGLCIPLEEVRQLQMQENQIQLQRSSVAVVIAAYLQLCKSSGSSGVWCRNTAWFVPWQPWSWLSHVFHPTRAKL